MKKPHYVQDDFYLGDGVNKVDKMDVYNLADFAITLTPITEDEKKNCFIDEKKVYTCISALRVCMENYVSYCGTENMEVMAKLFNCYTLLINDLIGKEYLFRIIYFKFFNQLLLLKGLPIESIKAFSKIHEDLEVIEQIGTVVNKEAVLRGNDINSIKTR